MSDLMNAPTPLIRKLDALLQRFGEVESQLADPGVTGNHHRLAALSKERGQLEPVCEQYRAFRRAAAQVGELRAMAGNRADPEMAELASAELPDGEAKARELLEALKDEFVAAEDKAVDSFFFEIRAGTGGEEAALFARDLFEMYRRYAETKRWRFDVSDFSVAERGGFKEVIINIKGDGAFRHLRFEGGGHRVQRVPETEAQGRIHTSAATIAVLPELQDVKIEINPKDVEEFGVRGGGPGGQNVNKVETGWRILHKPSGLQFKMTEHKSQAQNKDRAWALLRATLYEREMAKQHAEHTASRKAMMGTGDRSARIRTYNFPQNRCTDHRLGGEGGGEKNFNLDQVMAGELDPLVHALWELDKQQRLADL
jgi:peptide chain release factor 1